MLVTRLGLGSKVNLTSWAREEVRLEKGQRKKEPGEKKPRSARAKREGEGKKKRRKGVTYIRGIPKKFFSKTAL